MSSDTTLDASDAQAGTVTRRMKIRPGAAGTLKLKLSYPAMPDGNYYLLAQVDPDNAVPEASDSNNVAASAATFVNFAPVVDLSGTLPRTPPALTRGRRGAVAVSVLNGGNIPAAGVLTVRLYAADGNAPSSARTLLGEVVRPARIKAGGRKVLKFAFVPPADLPPETYYFAADIDTAAGFAESNESNNLAIAATSFTIAQ
jgi:hypothetical protein